MEIRFHLCLLELKTPTPEIKNSLNQLNSRLDTAEGKNNEREDTELETIQTETREKKTGGKYLLSLSDFWDIMRQSNKHVSRF